MVLFRCGSQEMVSASDKEQRERARKERLERLLGQKL